MPEHIALVNENSYVIKVTLTVFSNFALDDNVFFP